MKLRKNTNIEERATDTLLERPRVIKIGGQSYTVAPPTLATLMEVSGTISKLSKWRREEEGESVASVALERAKDAPTVCRAIAVLILGAKRPESKTFGVRGIWHWLWQWLWHSLWQWLWQKKQKTASIDTLTLELLHTASPTELLETLTELLEGMELGAFFGLTTFLREINVARPTREVE